MVYYLSRQVLILFVLIVYHINTTCSVPCLQFTNVMLLLKNLPIEHFSVPDLSSSVSALRLYLSLQLSGALWALTLTPCSQPYLDTAVSASLSLSPNAIHSFSITRINTACVFIICVFAIKIFPQVVFPPAEGSL